MAISIFDLFKISIGPSSSHTMGPMVAALQFAEQLQEDGLLEQTVRVSARLYGSLGLTGRAHGADRGIMLGLEGEHAETVNVDSMAEQLARIRNSDTLRLLKARNIDFNPERDLIFDRQHSLPAHPNGMQFTAYDAQEEVLRKKIFYSVGGGFVMDPDNAPGYASGTGKASPPHPFRSATALIAQCKLNRLSISGLMLANELAWRRGSMIHKGLLKRWRVMQDCVMRGCRTTGTLPGPLQVRRRAPALYEHLCARTMNNETDAMIAMDWVTLYALAVNEENAAGSRVVTAPTNGAAGIIPAVIHYYLRFCPNADDTGIVNFLLAAGAIGLLYKENASISGAEVGCQGEVGVACSMAAAGLTEALGGTPEQVENAAEIGMEHNLGLTCDPVGGRVQIPCIERNAMGAIKAINAARMALRNNGSHYVSLDRVIKTMRDTGDDMKRKYKETARGGLAVNVTEC